MNSLAQELKPIIFDEIENFFEHNKVCDCSFDSENQDRIDKIEKIFKHNVDLAHEFILTYYEHENGNFEKYVNHYWNFVDDNRMMLYGLKYEKNVEDWNQLLIRVKSKSKIIFIRHRVRKLSKSPESLHDLQKNVMNLVKNFDLDKIVSLRMVSSKWKEHIDSEILPFKVKEIMQKVLLKDTWVWSFYKSNPVYQTFNLSKKIGIAALSVMGIKFFNSEPETETWVTHTIETRFGQEREITSCLEHDQRKIALTGSSFGLAYSSGVIQYLFTEISEKTFLNFLKETVKIDILDFKTKISSVVFDGYVSWKIQKVKQNLLFPKNWDEEPALPLCQRSQIHLMFPSLIDQETDIRTSEDLDNEVMDIQRFYEIQEMIRERR